MADAVLVGDVGGTTTRFAVHDSELRMVARHPTKDAPDLAAALGPVWASLSAPVAHVAVAVAGPVEDGSARLTNAAWSADTRDLSMPCTLLNDLEAAAYGAQAVPADRMRAVGGEPVVSGGPRVVLGVGTGHGQAQWADGVAQAGEGGHADYAPTDPELARFAAGQAARYGRVSIERVVSGMACEDLLAFVAGELGAEAQAMWREQPAAAVMAALAEGDPGCARALDMFVRALGAVAGDAALRSLPSGGVWLAGGLVSRLIEGSRDSALRAAFEGKGRMRATLEGIPLIVVDDPEIVLRGAVVVARSEMH